MTAEDTITAEDTVTTVGTVHVVVPDAIDDPARPSGGNRYDRRICSGLAECGWQVHVHPVPDTWPRLGAAGLRQTARALSIIPDGAIVLVDGLIASAATAAVVADAKRLRVVVLVHTPLGEDRASRSAEAAVLHAARSVITTSAWTKEQLLARYRLPAESVHVAEPGVDPAFPAISTADGTRLLCVAAVAPHKGHDLLLAALTTLAQHRWRCAWVGPVERDPAYVARLRREIDAANLNTRVRLTGPLTGAALEHQYRSADLLVHASLGETYGMVVTEALAHGLPVIAAAAGGLPEALGHAPDGARPGMLVPPDDPSALAAALRTWLTQAPLRGRLRTAALARRRTLPRWTATTDRIARVLTSAAG